MAATLTVCFDPDDDRVSGGVQNRRICDRTHLPAYRGGYSNPPEAGGSNLGHPSCRSWAQSSKFITIATISTLFGDLPEGDMHLITYYEEILFPTALSWRGGAMTFKKIQN